MNNKVTTYVLYGIGEIFLVVVGILIAVSIDNWNEDYQDRKLEIKYLTNIKQDLEKDLERLEALIDFRKSKMQSCHTVLAEIRSEENTPLAPLARSISKLLWEGHFQPVNTTFSELSSSGNLNLISSDTIKIMLLELQNLYNINTLSIDHETFDYREYISKPMLNNVKLDVIKLIESGAKTAGELNLSKNDFQTLLNDVSYRNGVVMTESMSVAYIELYQDVADASTHIIEIIDRELQKD